MRTFERRWWWKISRFFKYRNHCLESERYICFIFETSHLTSCGRRAISNQVG